MSLGLKTHSHITCACSEVAPVFYLKDLQLDYKLYEGKDCVRLALWGVTKIKNSALIIVRAELIFVG